MDRIISLINNKKFTEAIRLLEGSNNPELQRIEAVCYQYLGNFPKAIDILEKIKTKLDSSEVFTDLALNYLNAGNIEEAEKNFLTALEKSEEFDSYQNLGVFYQSIGKLKEAAIYYNKALRLKAELQSYVSMIEILIHLEDNNAEIELETAKKLFPDSDDLIFLEGFYFEKKKEYQKAKAAYLKIINTQNPKLYFNLGNTCTELKHYDEAETYYRKAISLAPDFIDAYKNLAKLYYLNFDYNKALSVLNQGLGFDEKNRDLILNKAIILSGLGYNDEVLEQFNKLDLKNDREAAFYKSLHLLRKGNYKEGLPLYEMRDTNKCSFNEDLFNKIRKGENFNKKIVVIRREQGLGDFLMMLPLIKELKARNAFVILELGKESKKLVLNQKVADVLVENSPYNKYFDYEISLMSLPYYFGKELSAELIRNFRIKSNEYHDFEAKLRIKDNSKLKVALFWKGNSEFVYDFRRSIKLEEIISFLDFNKIELYSFQKDITKDERAFLAEKDATLFELSLEELPSYLKEMDLVISIDSAMLHLATLLGKNTIGLFYKDGDWRWGESTENIWYDKHLICLRQSKFGSWVDVFEKLNSVVEEKFELKSELFTEEENVKKNFSELIYVKDSGAIEKLIKRIDIEKLSDLELRVLLGEYFLEKDKNIAFKIFFSMLNTEIKSEVLKVLNSLSSELGKNEICLRINEILHEEDPENPVYITNIAKMHLSLNNLVAAKQNFLKALKYGEYEDIYNNLGITLYRLKEYDEAEKYFEKAIQISENPEGYILNLSNNYYAQRKFDKALEKYSLIENNFMAKISIGFIHLAKGNYPEGLEYFKYSLTPSILPEIKYWNGEDLSKKRLLVYADQGLGDIIQFSRFLLHLRNLNCEIDFHCNDVLVPVLKNLLPGINTIPKSTSLSPGEYDFQVNLLDIPRILKIKIEDISFPFQLPMEKKKERIKNVGIVFKGNPKHGLDHLRSIPLSSFEKLFELEEIKFHCILLEASEEEQAIINKYPNVEYLCKPLDELFKILPQLDLLVSVDTSLAHLAGSLGIETLLLLSYIPDWRWGLESERTPWYPSVKLIRQPENWDWNESILKVKEVISNRNSCLNPVTKAKALIDEGNIESAKKILNNCLQKEPDNWETYFYLGYIEHLNSNKEKALEYYRKSAEINSLNVVTLNNIGLILTDLKRFNEASEIYSLANNIEPRNEIVLNNWGIVLNYLGEFEKSETGFNRAIEIKPTYYEAYLNLANLYSDLNELDKAVASIDKCIEISPNYVDAHFTKSLIHLKKKDFKTGFREYEWRLKKKEILKRDYKFPRLKDEDVAGKRVFIYDEQAFGDSIQFSMFLKELKSKGAYIIFECHDPLYELMKNCKGVDELYKRSENIFNKIEADFHLPLLSLPYYLNLEYADVINSETYIDIKGELEIDLPLSSSGLNIGVFWEGRMPVNNLHRAIPLKELAPLMEDSDNKFFSFQLSDITERDMAIINQMGIIPLDKYIKNFKDTAQLLKKMDLLITIDSAIAHLAGALGIKAQVLLSTKADWRWFTDTEFSPWYPSLRLLRQKEYGNWKEVINAVKNKLKNN